MALSRTLSFSARSVKLFQNKAERGKNCEHKSTITWSKSSLVKSFIGFDRCLSIGTRDTYLQRSVES